MNALLQRDSLSEQVAEALEKRIVRGQLPAGSRLQSTRDLATAFDVSHQVLLRALDILERKKFVRRLPRKGVYVADSATCPDTREVLILIVGENPIGNHFGRLITNVVDSQTAAGRFHFTIRALTLSEAHRGDAVFKRRMLEAELPRLADRFHPDCALVLYPSLDRRQMEMLAGLPFPLLFVGDFLEDTFPGLEYNQLSFDQTDLLALYAARAAAQGMRRVALLSHSDTPAAPFFQRIVANGERAFAAAGVAFERLGHVEQVVAARPDMLLLSSNEPRFREGVLAKLTEAGLKPELGSLLTWELDRRFLGVVVAPEEVACLHGRLLELMDMLAKDKPINFRENYQLRSRLDT